jgi:Zn-dependent protease/predicted transcriptional regulator
MRWSFQIGRVFGIPIRVHITFFILPAIVWFAGSAHGAVIGGLTGVIFVLALFVCVVIHELGHSLVARRYGVEVRDIILLPIGGVSNMDRIPEDPKQELAISAIGPIVSAGIFVVIAALLTLVGKDAFSAPPLHDVIGSRMTLVGFIQQLMWINLLLAIFNLVPAFPMDGGRILRAFLAERMDYVKATHAASAVGQAFAFVFGFVGLFVNPWLIIIAVFIYMGAGQEEAQVRVRSVLRGVPASAAMITRFDVLRAQETLGHALARAGTGFQHDFPVVKDDHVVGMVTHQELLRGLHEVGPEHPVDEVMRTDVCERAPEDSLQDVYDEVAQGKCPVVAIMSGGVLTGMVTPESVSTYLMNATRHATIDRQRMKLGQ